LEGKKKRKATTEKTGEAPPKRSKEGGKGGWWTKKECRLKCEFGAGVFVRLDTFEYVLVSLSKVMVPISEVNATHWFHF
jgi:hypothetical protein